MWNYPNILEFKNAISDQKKINMGLVISFERIDKAINFITSRPNPVQIAFDSVTECEKHYERLRTMFCQEIDLSSNDDMPF